MVRRTDVLAELEPVPGKGEVLWRSLAATDSEIICFLDSDLVDFDPAFVPALLGPLLTEPRVQLVKGFYRRPLRLETTQTDTGGGRVTELLVRPLLAALRPELAGIVQPLGGEYAGTRELLESLPFAAGYGVEIGLLLDTHATRGLDAVAQVNLGVRKHRNRSLLQLGVMARQILAAVLAALRRRPGADSGAALVQFLQVDGEWLPTSTPVPLAPRPPLREVLVRCSCWCAGRFRRCGEMAAVGTALSYLLVAVVVAAALYGIAVVVFGRGEELPPLPPRATPTRLPEGEVAGGDVRELRFPQAVRGYRMGEVDWVLERLADELDRVGAERDGLAARVAELEAERPAPARTEGSRVTRTELVVPMQIEAPAGRGLAGRHRLGPAGGVDPRHPGAGRRRRGRPPAGSQGRGVHRGRAAGFHGSDGGGRVGPAAPLRGASPRAGGARRRRVRGDRTRPEPVSVRLVRAAGAAAGHAWARSAGRWCGPASGPGSRYSLRKLARLCEDRAREA